MFSKSSKALTLALFVAGGMQGGAKTSATAATLPSRGSLELLQTTESDGNVHPVHRRAYRH